MKTILQILGFRSRCCNAAIIAWHHDKHYCASCEQWLDRAVIAAQQVVQETIKPRTVH